MNDLFNLILDLTTENKKICEFVDSNLKLIQDTDLESMNKLTKNFYGFLEPYQSKIDTFKKSMADKDLKTIWDIKDIPGIKEDILKDTLKSFDLSVKESQKKLMLYSKLVSSELNMINKIEHLNKKDNIDLKF